jgi:hypothetical protein
VKNITTCPICGEGTLIARVGSNEVEYKGQGRLLPFHYRECTCCDSDQVSHEDVSQNKRLMTDFKKEVEAMYK